MNCAASEQFFDAYLDGELSGSLRLEFDAHRLRCPACQQKLAMMEACEHILARDESIPTLSNDFADRVMSDIDQRRLLVTRSRRRRITIAATIAFQAAAVLVFAVLWWGVLDSPTTPAPETGPLLEDVEIVLEGPGDRGEKHVAIRDLIFAEINRSDRETTTASFPDELKRDLRGYVQYATSNSVFGDISSPSELLPAGPLDALLRIFGPGARDDSESPPAETGPFSL